MEKKTNRNGWTVFSCRSFFKTLDIFFQSHCRGRLEEQMQPEQFPVFHNIEIETINRCNGSCSFCPVNRYLDQRPYQRMDEALFHDIIRQLEAMEYRGDVAFYSNNEPLLDNRITQWIAYARKRLPHALFNMNTNATLLTRETFYLLMEQLDYLVIDNYQDRLEYIPSVKALLSEIESPRFQNRVFLCLRREHELLFNRGGNSKNRGNPAVKIRSGCVFPFEQIVVRPDGKISLCCNDARGEITAGDLTKDSLLDIWRGEAFTEIRRSMLTGKA